MDSNGQTIDFMLRVKRDARAAKRFFRKMLKAASHSSPRVINVDKNPVYPPAVEHRKGQIAGIGRGAIQIQVSFVSNLFGIAT